MFFLVFFALFISASSFAQPSKIKECPFFSGLISLVFDSYDTLTIAYSQESSTNRGYFLAETFVHPNGSYIELPSEFKVNDMDYYCENLLFGGGFNKGGEAHGLLGSLFVPNSFDCGQNMEYIILDWMDVNGYYVTDHFRAPMTWESGGTLMWDVNARHHKWQVRICDNGQSPDNYLIDTCINVPYFTVDGLQSHTHYSAYVRGVCEHYGDTLYGNWSNGMDLYTVVDISKPDYSNEFVQLLPNPANDIVQVLSSFNIERVVIYDLHGKKVFDSGNVSGVSFSANVKDLNRGAYVVVIYNQQGICTKKLILQ